MTTNAPTVAIVGCGPWGANLVRNFSALESLRVVCDVDPDARTRARQIAPGVEVASDIDRAFAPDIDAVVVATPAATHVDVARRALLADKHVFVEKPLALTWEEGHALVGLAADRSRVLMVGHVLEYHPAIRRLRALVANGELGAIHYVYSHRLSLGRVRREENILWSFAPHDIAVMLRLMDALPTEVVTCGGNYLRPEIADVTVTHLTFPGGVRAHIHVSWLHPFKEQRLVVIGSRRMASFDDVAKTLLLYEQDANVRDGVPTRGAVPVTDVPFSKDEPLRLECEAFLSAVASGEAPLTDGVSALRVLRVLHAAQASLRASGTPVRPDIERTVS